MAGKRGNSEGSIRQRKDGSWEARITVGYESDGKLKRRSKYFKTREDGVKWMREAATSIDKGEYIEASKITVAQWLETWINEYVKPVDKPTTVGVYMDSIKNHIVPAVGRVQLQKLRTDQIQGMLNRMNDKGYSKSTLTKAKNVIHGALKQAVKNQLVPRNVSEGVVIKRRDDDEEGERKPLTREEQTAYTENLPDTTTGRALAFILGSGLRVGELCGLRWQDVDKDSFRIVQTVRRVPTLNENAATKTTIKASTPKTKNARREIPLTPKTRSILNAQREYQFKCGTLRNDGDLVFTTDNGKPLDVRNISRTHYSTLEKIGAERRGVHHLRHTFATRAVESGVMDYKTLSEILGHSDVSTTLRFYVHSNMETKTSAMQALAEYL